MEPKNNQLAPLKILHIISGDLWAGAEVQAYQTLAHLNKDRNLTLHCILFNEGILKDKIQRLNINTIVLDESKLNSFRLLLKLLEVLRMISPDIIHVHRVKEHFLAKLALMLIRGKSSIVRTLHGAKSNYHSLPMLKRIRSGIVGAVDDFVLRYHADATIAVSKDLENYLIRSGLTGRIYQVYNAVDIDNLINIQYDRGALRKRFGIDHGIWIGTAARLVEVKNIPMLIIAGQYMNEQGIPFKISIFGEGPLKDTLRELISNSGLETKVALHGFEPDILPIIASLDVFVLSSQHEGLPMALLEAMALSIPVVCTNVGGMAEIIENGVNGLLVSPNDSRALSDAIISLYKTDGLATKLVQKAYATIEDKYSLSSTGHGISNIYNCLAITGKGKN